MHLDILHVLTQSFQSKQRSRASFPIVICFRDVGSPHAFVCELFSITRIGQEFLLVKLQCFFRVWIKSQLPTHGCSHISRLYYIMFHKVQQWFNR